MQVPTTPTLTGLHDDLLSLIVANISPKDAISLSETACGVHYVAKFRALSTVSISSHEQMTRVCRHFLADVEGCLPHLRDLTMNHQCRVRRHLPVNCECREPHAVHLACLLEKAKSHRVIRISGMESFLPVEPRIGAALVVLPAVQELELEVADH